MARIFKPKQKVAHHIKVGNGALCADFYVNGKHPEESYLHIYAPNHKFEHKVQGFPFVYLLESVRQGNEAEVEAYCATVWRLSMEIYEDPVLCDAIVKAFNERDERLMKKGAVEAAMVTEAQEMADQAYMTDIAREADKHRGDGK